MIPYKNIVFSKYTKQITLKFVYNLKFFSQDRPDKNLKKLSLGYNAILKPNKYGSEMKVDNIIIQEPIIHICIYIHTRFVYDR